jgi:phage terminase large subunit-like protein
MEDLKGLHSLFPDFSDKELEKIAELRFKARTDHFFLGNELLGFTFEPSVHRGLFDAMLQKQPDKGLLDQDTAKNRLILWPRGHFKTSAEVVEVVQLILNFPNIRILIMSGKESLAKEILGVVKAQFEDNQKVKQLFPEFCGDDLGNTQSFKVRNRDNSTLRAPTVSISTEKSVKSGSHFDVIFCDDLVHDKNYRTADLIESTRLSYMHVSALLDPGGYMYLIGTRYTFDDLYGWILDTVTYNGSVPLQPLGTYELAQGWTEQNYKSADSTWVISSRSCWKKFLDTKGAVVRTELLFPQRFSIEKLQSEQRKDPIFFSCQWENTPLAGGSQTFTEELINGHLVQFEQVPQRGPVIVIWDTASGLSDDADESVGIAARIGPSGKVYVIDCVAGRFQPHELVQNIVGMVFKWRPVKLLIEKANGAVYLDPLLQNFCHTNRIQSLPLEWIVPKNAKNAKQARILALQSILKQDRLYFFAGLPNLDRLRTQFIKFPATKHDDYPDVVSLLMEIVPFIQLNNPLETHPAFRPQQTPLSTEQEEPNPLGSLGGLIHG